MTALVHRNNASNRPCTFLAGVGRSGTTWIQEIINFRNDHRTLFEPFWAQKVAVCRPYAVNQYLRSTSVYPEHLHAAQLVLAGDLQNPWVDQFASGAAAERVLIKDIRANLFMHWLSVNFPHVRFVLILRHPGAVCVSQQLSGFPGMVATSASGFLEDADLMADYLDPFADVIRGARTPVEHKAITWCIKNFVPLAQFSPDRLLVLFYEDMLLHPERELKRLAEYLRLDFDVRVWTPWSTPSALTTNNSTLTTGKNPVNAWRTQLSASEVKDVYAILTQFGFDRIYGENGLPVVPATHVVHMVKKFFASKRDVRCDVPVRVGSRIVRTPGAEYTPDPSALRP